MALGTFVAIEASASVESVALAAVESAYAAIAAVDRLMHPSRAGSDLARLNGAAPGHGVPLDPSTWSVLRLAQRVHAASGGTFDPCLPALPGRLTDLELSRTADGGTRSARCHRPLALDLGGIAKGYAVDRAVAALVAAGCIAGLVNAGGDLRLFGSRSETILVRHASGACVPHVLANTALAVSDLEAQRRPGEHRGYYRRDRGGGPTRRYAAVLAPEAAAADALTKCLLLGTGTDAARALRALRGVELAPGT
jgi:thiamine biosynthesis lipoprotein